MWRVGSEVGDERLAGAHRRLDELDAAVADLRSLGEAILERRMYVLGRVPKRQTKLLISCVNASVTCQGKMKI